MSHLGKIVDVAAPSRVIGFADAPVAGIACHPAQVTGPGFLFVCMNEYLEYNRWQTWRTHLECLPSLELSGLIAPEPVEGLAVPQLIVADPRRALGLASREVYGCPDSVLRLFGVTGTNGKTTTARLVSHLLSRLGISCGSIGTLGVDLPGVRSAPGTYTTPLAPELYASLAGLRDDGAGAVAMEVSSHALALERVAGLAFDGAILTNLERDHLDFHGTPEAYAEAKRLLFTKVKADGFCILNRASPHGDPFAAAASGKVLTYGMEGSGADYAAVDLALDPAGSRFTVQCGKESALFSCPLAGAFQVENSLAAIALVHALGWGLPEIAAALVDFPPVSGRMEQIPLPNGCTAIVDYAHNPDGLQHVLRACRPFCRGRLHVVFGCGGDRDKGKRPIMGEIAGRLADVCWVTSDNPRTEEADAIIADILAGMEMTVGVHCESDRAAAIRLAYAGTLDGDVLVVAGKGHEDYQIIGHEKHFFSDQAVLRSL